MSVLGFLDVFLNLRRCESYRMLARCVLCSRMGIRIGH